MAKATLGGYVRKGISAKKQAKPLKANNIESVEFRITELAKTVSSLIRTISRVANKFPDALFDHDLDRLTQAKEVLRKNSNNDKTQILNHGEK